MAYAPKFITIPGQFLSAGASPYWVCIPKHERCLTKQSTYAILADRIGCTETEVEMVTKAFGNAIAHFAVLGGVVVINGIARFELRCKGGFDSSIGPWVKGRNWIEVDPLELSQFKSTLGIAGIIPVNATKIGAKPTINTVMDTATEIYGELHPSDVIEICGIDLAPDSGASDEGVYIRTRKGNCYKCELLTSDLVRVTFRYAEEQIPEDELGKATLEVRTRAGFGEKFSLITVSKSVVLD